MSDQNSVSAAGKSIRESIEGSLSRAEDALRSGKSLERTGFWKAVSTLRRDRQLAREFGARVAAVDKRAFESSVRLRVPENAGVFLLVAGTAGGVVAIVVSSMLSGLWRPLVFLAGFGALDIAPHSLTHWLVGRLVGMKFTHFFLGGPPPPRPGAKVDYESYLAVSPRRRALMHASGAIVTKIAPFAVAPVALRLEMPTWVFAVLLIIGVVQVATDVALSRKTSDWKKVLRELRAARER